MVYTYATNFSSSLLWFDNFDALAKDIKFYKNYTKNWQTPTQKITVQGHPHAYNYYQGNLENYVVSKITFNTALEVDDIVHEYNNAYYKDSASVINGIYDELTGLDLSNLKLALYDSSQDYKAYFRAYSVNAVQRYISALDSEISRVKGLSGLTDTEKAERESRIIELRVQFEFMLHLYKTKVNSSFDMSSYGKNLLSDMDKLGIYYYGEGRPITELRDLYGTNVDKIATLLFQGNASKDANNPVKYEPFSFNMKDDFSVSSSNGDFNEKLNGGQLTLTWTVYHNTTPIISSDPTILKDNASCVYDSFTGSVYAFPNDYTRKGYRIVLTISGYGYFGDLVYYYDKK